MASEFLEILSPSAKAELEAIMPLVKELADNIKQINNFKASGTPSGSDKNIKGMADAYQKQGKALQELSVMQKQIEQNAKNQTIATQKLTKEELSYVQAVEKGVKAKEREVLANKKLSDAYGQLTTKRNEAGRALQNLIASERASTAEIKKAQREFDVLNKKVAAADKAVGKMSHGMVGLKNITMELMMAFGFMSGVQIAFDIVKNIYETTKQLQSLDLALKMVSGSQEEFANNQSFLKNLAEQYGIEIKGLTKNFTEFWVASKGKLEAEQIKAIFTSISKSVAVMGLSVEQQDSAFLALQQMMSKGTVQAEELKKQLGNALPGAVKAATMAYQALHPELKVTEKYFMEQMKAGKVLSAELLPELAKAYEKLYGIENVKRAETLQAAQERLSNTWTEMVRTMNESNSGGLVSFFKGAISLAQEFLIELNGIISSWQKLQKESNIKGIKTGREQFSQGISKVKTKEEADAFMKLESEIARQNIINQQTAIEIQRQRIAELKKVTVKNVLGSFVGYGAIEIKAAEQAIQKALELRGISEGTLQAIKEQQAKANSKSTGTGSASGGVTETDDQRKKRLASEAKAEKARLKSIEDTLKTEYDLKMSNLEREKEILADELKNEKDSLEYKLTLNDIYGLKEAQIAQAVYEEKVRLANGNSKLIQIAFNDQQTAIENAYEKSLENQKKIKEDYLKDEKDKTAEWYKNNPPFFTQSPAQKEALDAENKKREDDAKDRLESQRRAFNEFMGGFADKSGFGETFDLLGKINPETGKTIMGDLLDTDDKGEKTKAYFLAVTTVAQDAMNAIDQADEERYQRRLARLEKEKEVALSFAGDSAAAKEKIEADFEKKKKAMEIKEFKRKQKMTIANIAIDTAQAAMASWAKQDSLGLLLPLLQWELFK